MNATMQKKNEENKILTSEKLRFQIHTIKVVDGLIVVGLNLSLHKRIVSVKFYVQRLPRSQHPAAPHGRKSEDKHSMLQRKGENAFQIGFPTSTSLSPSVAMLGRS